MAGLISSIAAGCAAPSQSAKVTATATSTSNSHTHSHAATTTGQILYQLDWQWGKAKPAADGQSWEVVNDLGYRIRVTRGYLVTGNAQMVACPHTHAAVPATLGEQIAEAVTGLFAPSVAMAGHGEEGDPSRIKTPQVESLTAPIPIHLTAQWGNEPNYCEMHYLLAYGIASAQNLPSEVSMIGSSLLIEGEVRGPGQTEATPFSIKSPLAWGSNKALIATDGSIDPKTGVTAGTFLHLIIRRDLGNVFDGVDFVKMPPPDQAKQVLRSIIENTSVEAHCK
ncbi:MAG: hypothetical protein KIH69_012785 [Anaerolineae bacterium]|nr:hypothetical protein [Anaerolineae bacterium]